MALASQDINPLMDRASAGDAGAFEALAACVQDDLMRFALAQGLAAADAADAVQETLIRAYNARTRWRRGGRAGTWLCGIAMNVVREIRRERRRRAAVIDADVLADAMRAPSKSDPELLECLAEALEQLPPRQREAVACRYLRRMTVRRTAEAMGCAEGTVKAATAAAIENLRKNMKTPHRDTTSHD